MPIIQSTLRAVLLGAAATLAGCNNQPVANDANAAEITATNAAGTAAPATAVAESGAFNADFMVGKWSAVDEDCSATLEFREDGTVTTPIGVAKWTVDGDKLSIAYEDGSKPTVSSIKVLEPGRIEITHASGTKETEKRC